MYIALRIGLWYDFFFLCNNWKVHDISIINTYFTERILCKNSYQRERDDFVYLYKKNDYPLFPRNFNGSQFPRHKFFLVKIKMLNECSHHFMIWKNIYIKITHQNLYFFTNQILLMTLIIVHFNNKIMKVV